MALKASGSGPIRSPVARPLSCCISSSSRPKSKAYSTVFDNAKLRRVVPGYAATKKFADGIRETVEWFDSDPGRQQIDQAANARWDRLAAVYTEALAKAAGHADQR
jgi:hypothetical protein